MSLLDKLSYLLDSIMLLSRIITTMISTGKCERNNLPFTIEAILKGALNWNMYEISAPSNAINSCILYRLTFKEHGFLREDLIGYIHANFHHATRYVCWNIAFQIWWLPCNPHRSKWPKTFCGQCMYIVSIVWWLPLCQGASLVNMGNQANESTRGPN